MKNKLAKATANNKDSLRIMKSGQIITILELSSLICNVNDVFVLQRNIYGKIDSIGISFKRVEAILTYLSDTSNAPIVAEMWYNSATHGFSGFVYFVYTQAKVDYSIFINIYNEDSLLTGRSETIKFTSLAGDVEIPSFSPLNAIPVANAGNDTTVSINDTILLHGTATDTFGHVLKWEWDIGNTGSFSTVSLGDTVIIAPAIHDTIYECVLRVTDNHGNKCSDTVTIKVLQDIPVVSAGKDTFGLVNTPLTLTGTAPQQFGNILKYKWDFDGNGIWDDSSSTSMHSTITYNTLGNKTVIFAAVDDDGNLGKDTLTVFIGTLAGGVLSSNYTMSTNNSPYIITSNLLVPTGITLTIEAGTAILFSDSIGIKVDGTMSAMGSESGMIIFSYRSSIPKTSLWSGIQYGDSASTWSGTSGNILKYCRIEHAVSALSGKIAPQVEHCIISDNITAMDFDGDSRRGNPFLLAIYHSKIIDNLSGINARLAVNTYLFNDTIFNNTNSAFSADNYFSTCSIDSCLIENNGGGVGIDRGAASVTWNVINNNDYGISYSSDGGKNLTISHNNITNNKGYAIAFTEHGNHGTMVSITVTDNNIDSNESGIRHQLEYLATTFTIKNNNITNCQEYAFISGATNPIPASIDVTSNYWGEMDSTAIANVIYDFYDSFNLSKVLFEPFTPSLIGNAGR